MKDGLIMSLLFIDEETGSVSWGSILVVYFFPIMAVSAYFVMLKYTFEPDDSLAERLRNLELKN